MLVVPSARPCRMQNIPGHYRERSRPAHEHQDCRCNSSGDLFWLLHVEMMLAHRCRADDAQVYPGPWQPWLALFQTCLARLQRRLASFQVAPPTPALIGKSSEVG